MEVRLSLCWHRTPVHFGPRRRRASAEPLRHDAAEARRLRSGDRDQSSWTSTNRLNRQQSFLETESDGLVFRTLPEQPGLVDIFRLEWHAREVRCRVGRIADPGVATGVRGCPRPNSAIGR